LPSSALTADGQLHNRPYDLKQRSSDTDSTITARMPTYSVHMMLTAPYYTRDTHKGAMLKRSVFLHDLLRLLEVLLLDDRGQQDVPPAHPIVGPARAVAAGTDVGLREDAGPGAFELPGQGQTAKAVDIASDRVHDLLDAFAGHAVEPLDPRIDELERPQSLERAFRLIRRIEISEYRS